MKTHLAGLVAGLTAATLVFPLLNTLPVAAADTTNASTPGTTAGSVRAAVSLTTPPVGAYGTNARFSGTAWRYGTQTKLAGATIVLQRSPHGKAAWSNLTSAKTTTTGTFAMGVTLSGGYDYRAYYAGSATYTTAVSAAKYVYVAWKVILDGLSTTNNAQANSNNGTLNAKGRIYPAPPTGTHVWLQKYDAASKTWKNFMSGKTSGNSIAVKGDVRGNVNTWRLQVASRGWYFTGSSNSKLFAHYVWRGGFSRGILARGGTINSAFRIDTDNDPLGGWGLAWADQGGTSWVDIRTTGCLELFTGMHNYSDDTSAPTSMRFSLYKDGAMLRSVVIAPGGDIRGTVYHDIRGVNKIRLQVQASGATGLPLGMWRTGIICSN